MDNISIPMLFRKHVRLFEKHVRLFGETRTPFFRYAKALTIVEKGLFESYNDNMHSSEYKMQSKVFFTEYKSEGGGWLREEAIRSGVGKDCK